MDVSKGSKVPLAGVAYTVGIETAAGSGAVDLTAVLLAANGKVRSDDDLVFFNNPTQPGIRITSNGSIDVDLSAIPTDVHRVLITGSTEAQGKRFGDVRELTVAVRGAREPVRFAPPNLSTETVLQMVAFYRRDGGWRLDAIGQGYSEGLAAFATAHGIDVEEPEPVDTEQAISFDKVQVVLTKDSPDKTARIDLRKSRGETGWVLTVGLEWDGRGAKYGPDGRVTRYGQGDLDVYFFCRNEDTNDYVIISGENGHRGDLNKWPFIRHGGDSKDPGRGGKPAVEQVEVRPNENGDLLVNVYQSVDNGTGALNTFGKPRIAVRYGRAGADGQPGPDADEVLVHVGNSRNSYWVTVAHIDVQDGVLTVDGETRYSRPHSEAMPGLTTKSVWKREPADGPTGRSKRKHGTGLDRYSGRCPSR